MSIKTNSNRVDWNINNEGFDYVKLRELEEGQEYPLYGAFISKDHGFGEGAVLISDGINVNIPARYVETIRGWLNDETAITEIKSGKATFKYETFVSKKYSRTGYRLIFDVK